MGVELRSGGGQRDGTGIPGSDDAPAPRIDSLIACQVLNVGYMLDMLPERDRCDPDVADRANRHD